mmetsp:Transcript_497/g.341  ORF Transcript_497/g.341 Transcript_497/m.341 type:complete len:131 (-) Transcript_497:47-439(-)
MFKNHTAETGIESIVTNDIIYELSKNRIEVLTNESEYDAILTGVITSISDRIISHTQLNVSDERRVEIVVDVKISSKEGEVIWSAQGLSVNETYKVECEKLSTEQKRHDAIIELSKRLAEKIYYRLTENF